MSQRTVAEEIKYQFRFGGMTIKLIMINLGVFLLLSIFEVFARLMGGSFALGVGYVIQKLFTLPTPVGELLTQPWTLFTYQFTHFGLLHFAFNMLFLYFTGRMFEQFFDQRRLLYTYILGGLFGGLFEVLARLIFPTLIGTATTVVGASGSVMAVMIALAFHRPNLKVALYGIFEIRIIFLALLLFAKDLFSLGINDGTAHFAHLGGAILGMLSIRNVYSSSNIINLVHGWMDKIRKAIGVLFNPTNKTKLKKQAGGATRGPGFKTDEQFNMEAKQRQEKIDKILDKISKSGYDSLTKEEKNFLFSQSKK